MIPCEDRSCEVVKLTITATTAITLAFLLSVVKATFRHLPRLTNVGTECLPASAAFAKSENTSDHQSTATKSKPSLASSSQIGTPDSAKRDRLLLRFSNLRQTSPVHRMSLFRCRHPARPWQIFLASAVRTQLPRSREAEQEGTTSNHRTVSVVAPPRATLPGIVATPVRNCRRVRRNRRTASTRHLPSSM